MPFVSAYLGCWLCGKPLVVINSRDVLRKRFCSHSCRQKWRYEQGEFVWLKRFSEAGSTPESNAKKGFKRDAHPKWLKDRTLIKNKRRCVEAREWRQKVFERDNYTCQQCQKRGGRLNAHHIKPFSIFPELRFDVNNGQTLCVGCHFKTASYAKPAKMLKLIYQ